MSLIDIKCQESIYVTGNCCYNNKDKERLLLGQSCCDDYWVYLYFELPSCLDIKKLKQVRLILFKIPQDEQEAVYSKNKCDQYSIGPLLDFFSIYSCNFAAPRIDYNQIIDFKDEVHGSYTEIDITDIAKTWIEQKIENKGLLLWGKKNAQLVTYASNRYGIEGMQPRVRLIYQENCFCNQLSMVPCTVEVRSVNSTTKTI